MMIIKEYCEEAKKCVIRTNTYSHNFEIITKLVNIAKNDFPSLTDNSIEIVQFAGQSYARTYGIEFNTTCYYPEGYRPINQLEFTY